MTRANPVLHERPDGKGVKGGKLPQERRTVSVCTLVVCLHTRCLPALQ